MAALTCNLASWLGSSDPAAQTALFALSEWSGSGVQSIGNYEMCLQSGSQLCVGDSPFGSMGVCVPPVCGPSDFGDVTTGLAGFVMSRSLIFSAAAGGNASIIAETLSAPGAVTCGDNAYSWTGWRVVAVVVFALIALWAAIATWHSLYYNPPTQSVSKTSKAVALADGAASAATPTPIPSPIILAVDNGQGATKGSVEMMGTIETTREPLLGGSGEENPPQPSRKKGRPSTLKVLLESFDIIRNAAFLFDVRPPEKDSFPLFHFLRVISSVWVVVGHSATQGFGPGFTNSGVLFGGDDSPLKKWWFQNVVGAEFSVDVFFWLAGFLAMFVLVGRQRRKNDEEQEGGRTQSASAAKRIGACSLRALLAFTLRYLRILPLLAAALVVSWAFFPMIGSGPFWALNQGLTGTCSQYWWATLLMIGEFVPADNNFANMCLGHAWYLFCDTFFFIFFAALGVGLKQRVFSKRGVVLVLLLSTAASIAAAWVVAVQNFPFTPNALAAVPPGMKQANNYYDVYYTKPWMRWPAASIGALFFFLHQYLAGAIRGFGVYKASESGSSGKKASASASASSAGSIQAWGEAADETALRPLPFWARFWQVLLFRLWWLTAAVSIGIIFLVISLTVSQDQGDGWSKQALSFYTSCSKPIFVAACGLVFLVTQANRGSAYTRFFGAGVWQVLGKLTFGIYLFHLGILLMLIGGQTSLVQYSFSWVIETFSATYFCTVLVSVLVYLVIELPAAHLVKHFILQGVKLE